MKIAFIMNKGNKQTDGPERWKNTMVNELEKKHCVMKIDTLNVFTILKSIAKAQIVQTYNQSVLTVFYLILARLLNKKIIHTVHGNYYEEQKNKKYLKRIFWLPFNKVCTYLSNAVVFPSRYLYRKILEKEPYLLKKSYIIPNGIDVESINAVRKYSKNDLGLKSNDYLVIAVTNFNLYQKASGIDLLIKEFNIFKCKNKYLFIIGGGSMLEDYRLKYKATNIRFLGFKNDVIKYIKTADLFVHYSFLDNFPLVILEALACKKPVIAKGFPSCKEILGIQTSLDKMNIKKIYVLQQELASKISEYDIRYVIKKYENLYVS